MFYFVIYMFYNKTFIMLHIRSLILLSMQNTVCLYESDGIGFLTVTHDMTFYFDKFSKMVCIREFFVPEIIPNVHDSWSIFRVRSIFPGAIIELDHNIQFSCFIPIHPSLLSDMHIDCFLLRIKLLCAT